MSYSPGGGGGGTTVPNPLPVTGPVTNTELRATPVPVSGSFFPATQPVSIAASVAVTGPATNAELRATALPVSGPMTDTQLRASPVPVSGSFFQATQPVSIAATVPVSGPLTDTQLRASAVPVSGPVTDTQLRASAVPVSIAAAVSTNATLQPLAAATSTPSAVVSLGNSQGKTVVGKPGSLASVATTLQVIAGASGTVTAGKTFYVTAIQVQARLTTFAATATLFGIASFRIATVAILTVELAGPGVDDNAGWIIFPEPIPIAAGVAYDWACTPAAVTAFTWKANIVGYEK